MKTNSILSKSIFFFFLAIISGPLSGQYSTIYHHPAQELTGFNHVAEDNNGNTVAAGSFVNALSLGNFTLNTGGTSTGFIGKYNPINSSWLWARQIELIHGTQGSSSSIEDLIVDNAGNVYITGNYHGNVKFGNTTLSSTKSGQYHTMDLFIAKMDPNGNFIWAKSFGTKAGGDRGRSIELDPSGNIYITGSFCNRQLFCGVTVDINDIYVAKLNSSDTAIWQKRFPPSQVACGRGGWGNDVTLDASGYILVTGEYAGTFKFANGAGFTISSINNTADVFSLKLTNSGTPSWVKSAGGTGNDQGDAIYTDESSNVYIGGRFGNYSEGNFTIGNITLNPTGGECNSFLGKYSSSGNIIWAIDPSPSPVYQASVEDIISRAIGEISVAIPFIGIKTISQTDGAIISFDEIIDNIIYVDGFYAPKLEIRDLNAASQGSIHVMSGYCGTDVGFSNLSLTSTCNDCLNWISCSPDIYSDAFIIRGQFNEPPVEFNSNNTSAGFVNSSVNNSIDEILVYPNPTNGYLSISIHDLNGEKSELRFLTLAGDELLSKKVIDGQNIDLDISGYPPGLYLIVLNTPKGNWYEKIFKE